MPTDRVLVTGAGGFIGGHLATTLVKQGYAVRAFLRYNSRTDRGSLENHDSAVVAEMDVVFGDLRDAESVTAAVTGCDVVLHLAAQVAIPYSYINARDFVETNVGGTLNVAEACLRTAVQRLVQTSTSEVYGSAQTVPMTEDHPLGALSPYAASKVGADQLVLSYHRAHGLPATVLRPFNTYGPHQSARAVVPTILTQALAGEEVALGALDTRRDLTYVSDTVAGFIAAFRADVAVGQTVQLGTGEDVSVAEIVALTEQLLGRRLRVRIDERRIRPAASEVRRLVSDPSRARQLLGWAPRVDLADGLSRTLEWLSENTDGYRPHEYAV